MNAPTIPAKPAAAVAPAVKPADPTKAQTTSQVVKAPSFQITPMKSRHAWIKCLFYAKYGEGKTSLAGSAVDVPGMTDVLMVNAESGQMSIETAEHIKHAHLIDQVRATDFYQVASVQEFLKVHCQHRDNNDVEKLKALQARVFGYSKDIIDEECKDDEYDEDDNGIRTYTRVRLRRYRTAIVDSLTEIDTFSMYQLLGIKIDMKLDEEMEVAQFAEFRKNNQLMQLLVRAYRDLPMHVLMVAAAQYTQDEMKRMHWTPQITGKLAAQIQGFVDIVGFLQTGKPKEGEKNIPRRLHIQPTGLFDAKSRLAHFKEPFIDNASMKKIMDIFKNAPKSPT